MNAIPLALILCCALTNALGVGPYFPIKQKAGDEGVTAFEAQWYGLWLANCCFAHISLGFPFLLRFYDEQSGHSLYPFHRYPGPLARTRRRSFPSCGVASS